MKVEENHIEFACSGRRHYVNGSVIGISKNLGTYSGYDDNLAAEEFSPEEQIELAEVMVARWMRFLAEARAKHPAVEENRYGAIQLTVVASSCVILGDKTTVGFSSQSRLVNKRHAEGEALKSVLICCQAFTDPDYDSFPCKPAFDLKSILPKEAE